MATPSVTVLIDTYNHERFIAQAIRSVLEQDFPPSELEIIVVDDGSTDGTPEVVKKFAPHVRILRKMNGGQASAFNAGIAEARGEIVAFLDGDDWWAAGKLAAVMDVFSREPSVGLVGHGITHVLLDGTHDLECIRETTRFRVISQQTAKKFRLCRGFLGTSRMSYRTEILQRIGRVPETLKFEADEYLFTTASVLTDVVILRDALTFYRLHDKNFFQTTNATPEALRSKQRVLASLAVALKQKCEEYQLAPEVKDAIVECVQVEADLLRLVLDSGFPWETIITESKIMRIFHEEASAVQKLFSYARLLPALMLPAATYYRWRYQVSSLELYKSVRHRFFPFPVPKHVERRETTHVRGPEAPTKREVLLK